MRIGIGWQKGIIITTKSGVIKFDPVTSKNLGASQIFISHAHSDHIRGLSYDVDGYLTVETNDILYKRGVKRKLKNIIPLKYGDKVSIDDLDIIVHNSGHILGSAQYEIRDDTSTTVYTGDLNCREMLTTNAAKVIRCDTLILETTYGNPFFVFPKLSDVYTRIINWAISEIRKEKIPTFMVYAVGKAQEIIKLFNEYTTIPVVTSRSVGKICEAYNKNGVKLNYIESTSKDGIEILKQPCVLVMSNHEKYSGLSSCSFAAATGWALKFRLRSVDATFPLSSHADFNQLVNYVKHAKPKKVFSVHGYKEYFASYISRKLDVNAREIPPIKQSNLRSFM